MRLSKMTRKIVPAATAVILGLLASPGCAQRSFVVPMGAGATSDAVWVSRGHVLFRCDKPPGSEPRCLEAGFFYTQK